MSKNIGEYLEQFALSVDMVDGETFDRIKAMLSRYFEENLEADFFEIQIDGTKIRKGNASKNALKTIWTNGVETTNEMFKEDGSYYGQTIYSYDKEIPIWVVATNKAPLKDVDDDNNYTDFWSQSNDLPHYWDYANLGAKTSIVIPLNYGSRTFGFINFEFKEYIECSEIAKQELKKLSDAIARLIWLQEIHKNQINDTKKAVQKLRSVITSKQSFLKKPKIFLASSSNADSEVIAQIRRILNRYNERFSVVFWESISESGDINATLAREINNCDLGICYFSEPNESTDQEYQFKDNPNVLFEAGMLYLLNLLEDTKSWIPIREGSSPRVPFDVSAQRLIEITRLADGTVNSHELEDQLVRMLDACIRL